MTSMPWFRVYSDILTDRKINRICKKTGQSKALVIGVWICLLALANDSPQRGFLLLSDDMPYTTEDIEDETGLPREILEQLLDEYRAHGMLNGKTTLEITNWSKRQYKSDNVTERVQRHREKRYDETLPKRYETVIDTESDTETESYISPLQTAFINASGIGSYSTADAEIYQELDKQGVSPADITNAVRTLQGKKYTIKGPQSIVTTAINIAKQNNHNNYERPASEVY